jgi:hypothetical protein
MKKLTKSERKKLAALYREAATFIGEECTGCCAAIDKVVQRQNPYDPAPQKFFSIIFEPRNAIFFWWTTGPKGVEPRRFALLLAAEEAERGTITDYAQNP